MPEVLGLSALLAPERQIDPGALPDPVLEEELPLEQLAVQNPGSFECRVDTLTWRPSAACDSAASTIMLLDPHGKSTACRLEAVQAKLSRCASHYRYAGAPRICPRPACRRQPFGAKNMAVVRHFAIKLVRAVTDKKSLKLRRKLAGWDTRYLKSILGLPAR